MSLLMVTSSSMAPFRPPGHALLQVLHVLHALGVGFHFVLDYQGRLQSSRLLHFSFSMTMGHTGTFIGTKALLSGSQGCTMGGSQKLSKYRRHYPEKVPNLSQNLPKPYPSNGILGGSQNDTPKKVFGRYPNRSQDTPMHSQWTPKSLPNPCFRVCFGTFLGTISFY
jgi:hypothetical protein